MRVAVLALVAGLVLILLVSVAVSSRTDGHRGGTAATVGGRLVGDVRSTAATEALLRRWRDRAAWWRLSIALPAVALTIVASVTLRSSLDVGIGAHPAWSDPLLMGLLGAFLGAVTAEVHLLRRPAPQRRVAQLEPRDLADRLAVRTGLHDGGRRALRRGGPHRGADRLPGAGRHLVAPQQPPAAPARHPGRSGRPRTGTAVIVEVDARDPTPVYEQIRAQVELMAATGTLTPGTRLPTIRQLAADLGLAKGTVAKAYEGLLRDGVVRSAGRNGTVVAEVEPLDRDTREAQLSEAAQTFAVRARQLGVDADIALAAVRQAIDGLD